MQEQDIQNSAAIQSRFPEVYKAFFQKTPVVVSSDAYFLFSSGIQWRFGAPQIAHKLPFRGFVGIEPLKTKGKIEIGDEHFYYNHHREFREPDYEYMNWKDTLPYMEQLFKKRYGEDFQGVRINFLLETPDPVRFDIAITITMMIAADVFFGKLAPEDVPKLANLSSAELNAGETPLSQYFQNVHHTAIKIRSFSTGGILSGSRSCFSIFASDYPMVFFSEERGGSVAHPVKDIFPIDLSDNVERYDELQTWFYRLNELREITGKFPLDVVCVYPGSHREKDTAREYVKDVVLPGFKELENYTRALFAPTPMDQDHLPPFLKPFERPEPYMYHFSKGQIVRMLYVLRALIQLYEKKLSIGPTHEFMDSIKTSLRSNGPFEAPPSPVIRKIIRAIDERADAMGIPVGYRIFHWGEQDGNMMLFLPQTKFRLQIQSIVDQLQSELNPDIKIDYMSWRDGFGGPGVQLEQFIEKGIFSDHLNPNSRTLLVKENGEVNKSIVEADEDLKFQVDLFIDLKSNKVFIGGEPVTSKDLPSQKGTAEILHYLLTHVDQIISSKDLPQSGYTKYRNEFQGKIASPLSRVLKARLKKELGLKVYGDLTHFYLKFNPEALTIGVLEK